MTFPDSQKQYRMIINFMLSYYSDYKNHKNYSVNVGALQDYLQI